MTNSTTNPKVDAYIRNSKTWREEFEQLRSIILACGLTEQLKWGVPCYTFESKNVVLIHGFKDYCAILFVKGALLRDDDRVLIRQTENVQAARQIRFASVRDVVEMKATLKTYVREAIEIEKAGLIVALKETADYPTPDEFQGKLDKIPGLKTAFDALTPGRRRAYLLFFTAPKQSKTRESRVEKCVAKILEGKGLDD
ncbi:YdeI/OmpD-associated family protein [Roseiarcus sp.]|uniref:YdeI/OmpD-associated family protein n=1 Tax=Roseiarcus sp. TaxID=1969460 RepID=UPI003F947677